MRKTRLVLIPGVKSLDTIGCLLLFLACPTIAFKGQENREVDTICKAQNLKEFWLDSPWPGDTDNIGWVRKYGGGTWPGNSQMQHTCNGLSTRSVALSRRSEDRHVQVRRGVSRDDGTETRKMRLENNMRRDSRKETINSRTGLHIRGSRREAERVVLDGERRTDSRRVRENRADSRASSRSFDREIRSEREFRELDSMRDSSVRHKNFVRAKSTEERTVTIREVVEGRRNSRASTRRNDREVRLEREVRGFQNRKTVRGRTDEIMPTERRIVRNREAIDGRRDSRRSIRSLDARSERRTSDVESRRASLTLERADSQVSDERVRSVVRQNEVNRRVGERANSRHPASSLEREIRAKRDVSKGRVVRVQQSREVDERESAERHNIDGRRSLEDRRNSKIQNQRHDVRSEREERGLDTRRSFDDRRSQNIDGRRSLEDRRDSKIQNQRRDIRSERGIRELDSRRSLDDRRDSKVQYQRQDVRSKREIRELDSQSRDTMHRRARTTERQTISDRKVVDVRRVSSRSLDHKIRNKQEVRGLEVDRETRYQTRARLSTRSLDRQIRSERSAVEINDHRNIPGGDSRQTNNFRSADEQRISSRRERENIRSSRQPIGSIGHENRFLDVQQRNAMRTRGFDVNIRSNEVEREARSVERAHYERVSRRVGDVERVYENRVHNSRSPSRLLWSIRSLEDNRQSDSKSRRASISRESGRFENKIEVERKITREGRNLDRFARGIDERQNELRQSREQSRRLQRLSRSSGDIRQSEQRTSLAGAERESQGTDMRRNEGERAARLVQRAYSERNSRRVVGVERAGVRDDKRSQFLTRRQQRNVRSVGNIGRSDRLTQRAEITGGNIIMHRRRNEIDRETRNTIRTSAERLSHPERAHTGRAEARSLEDIRRFDRHMSYTHDRRQNARADSRHREVERISRNHHKATPERVNLLLASTERAERLTPEVSRSQHLTRAQGNERQAITERESRRLDRREIERENQQRQLTSAEFRQFDIRDSQDTGIRRIRRDISLKSETMRTFPKEARRSDRQRRVSDVSRDFPQNVDKRRENNFAPDSFRRFDEHSELTNKPRMLDIRGRYAGKTNAFEREFDHQKLSHKTENGFFESSKNALASWLTTDISRTDLNGIAETLMYGGIACFALFSNVNRKVIF